MLEKLLNIIVSVYEDCFKRIKFKKISLEDFFFFYPSYIGGEKKLNKSLR